MARGSDCRTAPLRRSAIASLKKRIGSTGGLDELRRSSNRLNLSFDLDTALGVLIGILVMSRMLIDPLLRTERGRGSRLPGDNQFDFEGMSWVARTNVRWRQVPDEYGEWDSVFRQYRRWVLTGVFAVRRCDGLGRSLCLVLAPMQAHDVSDFGFLFGMLADGFDTLLADKGYCANTIRAELVNADAEAVIPTKNNCRIPIQHFRENTAGATS